MPTPLNQALDSDFLRRRFPRSSLWGNWAAFQSRSSVEVEALSGACMLLSSELFHRLGGFSPEFFMYGEDLDLCLKTRALGLRNYFVPAARVIHHGGQSSVLQFKKFSAIMVRESDCFLLQKWHGRLAALAYRGLMAVSALVRLGLLAPSVSFAPASSRLARQHALLKWLAILRWSCGGERWVREYSPARHDPGLAAPDISA